MAYRGVIIEFIRNIKKDLKEYESNVLAAVYELKEHNKEDSKYSDKYREQYTKLHRNDAKTAIQYEKTRCQTAVADSIEGIRKVYRLASAEVPSEKALAAIRVFRDFDLPMTKDDVQSIAAVLADNPLGVRVLSSVAAASGWKVSAPVWDSLPDAIDRLETAMRSPEMDSFWRIPEYAALRDGEMNAVMVNADAVMLSEALRRLTAIADDMESQGALVYAAKETETTAEEKAEGQGRNAASDAVTVSQAESDAERIARQIGIEKSTDDAVAKVGAERYSMKG